MDTEFLRGPSAHSWTKNPLTPTITVHWTAQLSSRFYLTQMRVLALDTTTRTGSVAFVEDDRIVAECVGDPTRTHTSRLPGELLALLGPAGLTPSDVDIFAVAVGPGSFTGLRTGIATVQGLALVTGRRVVAVSALEALAHVASLDRPAGTLVGAWIDAHRRDVFSAAYRVADRPPFDLSRLVEVDAPQVGRPETILTHWSGANRVPAVIAGDGAMLYAEVVGTCSVAIPLPALAGAIGRLAVSFARAGRALEPAAVQPLYIRRPDVEIARDQGQPAVQAATDPRR
jgi:tRNA threonylcarbamoyladenosine biosynthesis protein TsaB